MEHSHKTIDKIYGGAVEKENPGDALLLYFVGHGLPVGLLESTARLEEVAEESEDIYEEGQEGEQEGLVGMRGLKLVTAKQQELTGIVPCSNILPKLEAGVAGGVHTTLIADACHSGEAADHIWVKAEEKLAKTEKPGVKVAMT